MSKKRLKQLLDKFLTDTCSEAEMEELLKLFKKAENEPGIKELLDDYWFQLSEVETEDIAEDKDKWFKEIYSQAITREGVMVNNKQQWKKSGLFSYNNKSSQWLKVAAILVMSFCLSLFYYMLSSDNPENEVVFELKTSGLGERVQFTLPDGTRVQLNSGSRLEYPVPFSETSREVHLEGEAYLIVERDEDRPFLVYTPEMITRVLGTSFNIRSYPEDEQVIVAVSSGKVAVSENDMLDSEEGVILEADQWASYNLNTRILSKGSGDISSYVAWHEGVLLYHDKTLGEVAILLERWYGVSISLENEELKDCVIRGEHRNETLVNVLNAITYAFDVEYTIDGRQVLLRGEGCN